MKLNTIQNGEAKMFTEALERALKTVDAELKQFLKSSDVCIGDVFYAANIRRNIKLLRSMGVKRVKREKLQCRLSANGQHIQ